MTLLLIEYPSGAGYFCGSIHQSIIQGVNMKEDEI